MGTCANGQIRIPGANAAGMGKGITPFSFTSLQEALLINAILLLLVYFHGCTICSSFPAVGAIRASRAGWKLCLSVAKRIHQQWFG